MRVRQTNRKACAFPNCMVYVLLDSKDANRIMPLCMHDPRVCVHGPALFADLQQLGALGIPADVTYED